MSTDRAWTGLMLGAALFLSAACAPDQPLIEQRATPRSVDGSQPTVTNRPNPTATESILLVPTPSAFPSPTSQRNLLTFQWSLQTGTLQYVGVASDGTAYGVDEKLYAVISRDGVLLETTSLDLKKCLRYNFSGGSGAMGTSDWFAVTPDGTLVSYAYIGGMGPCMIQPGTPPVLQTNIPLRFLPYADGSPLRERAPWPEGFEWPRFPAMLGRMFWIDGRRDGDTDFFLNAASRAAGFINHNGEMNTFALADDLDLSKTRPSVLITPWDAVYYSYRTYDTLGNMTGDKIVRVEAGGSVQAVREIPSLLLREPVTYLPQTKELFYIEGDQLLRYGIGFDLLETYVLPADFVPSGSIFVGNDLALYVFSRGTLTKYALGSD